ncbi:MAG: hypothetical protein ACLQFR_10880 [Streptosporangiaceae bacterium]
MIPVTDEQLMRAALVDLTHDQPPMPPGRFQGVRRRAIRHRRRQLAAAVVSALAVVGIVVGAGRLPAVLHGRPQARPVPGWALPWPDYRNGSVPQSVLNDAVLAWHEGAVGKTAPAPLSPAQIARQVKSYHVTWYVGQKVAHGQLVAVMFEATSPATGRVLVVGWADASAVMGGEAAWSSNGSPWILTTKAAPRRPGSFGPDISEYVSGPSASGPGDTWIVVLPAPGLQLDTWNSVSSAGGVAINGIQSSGVVATDVGQLRADTVLGFGGARTEYVPVGIGQMAALAPLAQSALVLRPPFSAISSWTGQGNQMDGGPRPAPYGGPVAVFGSCFNAAPDDYGMARPTPAGHGRLRITINGHILGAITCDRQQHELTVPRSMLRSHGFMIEMGSSALTSWQLAFGRIR